MKISNWTAYSKDKQTCFFPEAGLTGYYRLQTTDPEIIRKMKHNVSDKKTWNISATPFFNGSPYIFKKYFESKRNAERAFKNILK